MKSLPVAIYARVSSDQQTDAHTIASQLAALRTRVATDGFGLPEEMQFIDEGYSGATLVRPGLERLRDLVAAGGVERLYVHSPDRLARKYAYQVLLMDEFQRAGVEVIFLNRELGRSPEDELLLQVQGMVAEYERAKILERSRRGKRHAAHAGVVSVLCGAPYGYHYISKQLGGGTARFEIVEQEARVVRQVFTWVGQERVSIGEVCRRLQRAGEPRRDGKTTWDRSVVWGMLKNPAYKGLAGFGKTRVGALKVRLRAQRGRSLQPRQPYAIEDVPREAWILVPVPAIIGAELYDLVQEQLAENRQRARQGRRGVRYLLQGLLVCKVCGYAYYGKAISPSSRKGHPRAYAYYRCLGTDAYRFGGQRICPNTQVRTDLVEGAVWKEVERLLEHPQRLEQEYRRRGQAPRRGSQWETAESLRAQSHKLRQGIARLIDGYAEGVIAKEEFEPRITRMKQRVKALEDRLQQLADDAAQQRDLQLIIGQLEDFVAKVRGGLATADWRARREIIRALVRRVEIDQPHVTVVFRVPPAASTTGPDGGVLPDCRRGGHAALRRPGGRALNPPCLQDASLQPLIDQSPNDPVGDSSGQQLAQLGVVERREVAGSIHIEDPATPVVHDVVTQLAQRQVG
jgi:site-specific DNA recombinase